MKLKFTLVVMAIAALFGGHETSARKPQADPSDMRYYNFYGWEHQSIESVGVAEFLPPAGIHDYVIPSDWGVKVLPDGRLDHPEQIELMRPGVWFVTFRGAKQACIDYWIEQKEIAEEGYRIARTQSANELKPIP